MAKTLKQAKLLIKECIKTQDTYLDLGNCGITDLGKVPELFQCVHLKVLILSSRWWTFQTKTLGRSRNAGEANVIRSLSSGIVNLKNLAILIICGSENKRYKISDIELIGKLTQLQTLNISENEISDYGFLENLTELRSLYNSSNNISNVSSFSNLSELEYFDLYENNITQIDFLEKFRKLKHLDLRDNPIKNIDVLSKLDDLESLYLRGIQETNFAFLKKLRKLKTLTIDRSQVEDVYFLSDLTNLQDLSLRDNRISDIDPLRELSELKNLDLRSNRVTHIPSWIFNLGMTLRADLYAAPGDGLSVTGNPIQSPPFEILKQGKQSIINWLAANKKKLEEIKVILIGDPKAGKTSLLRRFKEGKFDDKEPQTDGINIEHIHFGNCPNFDSQKSLHHLTGHFWDFGGQEIMNATHQFFLTSRSVYILVLDARKDNDASTQIKQWIKRIKSTGGNSPIIVVANQSDVNAGFGFSNEYELKQEFPQIKDFIKASCKTNEGIDSIKLKLEELIPQAELFNTEVDERWIEIMLQLQDETKNKRFLNEARFISICQDHQLREREGQKNAINFLHDLGLVLHFEDLNQNLAEYYVLDPYWITYGVYRILTSTRAGENKGLVGMNELDYIINQEESKKNAYQAPNQEKIIYTTAERKFLVDILNQFKLSFYLPGQTHFIIPDLLDTNEPEKEAKKIRETKDAVRFAYNYEYLPKSVMPYIMAETHHLIEYKWRTGCILNNGDCKALISAYANRLSIAIVGAFKKKREFLAVIRYLIDSINQKLSDKPQMQIPLPGINAFADYQVLLNREKKGKTTYFHDEDKPSEQEFEISVLLEGIPNQDEIKEINKKVDKLLDGNSRIETKIDGLSAKLEIHFQYLIDQPINSQIKEELLIAISEMNKQQTQEVVDEMLIMIGNAMELGETSLDSKLKQLYTDLKKSDSLEMKLKLGVPLINLLGADLSIEAKFDPRKWAKEKYQKYKFEVFKTMGYIDYRATRVKAEFEE